jgi:hypothetical protein
MRSRRRKLTKAELRAMGASPGLMARRVGPDGRARLEMLAPEGPERRRDFIRRLTSTGEETKASEGSDTA